MEFKFKKFHVLDVGCRQSSRSNLMKILFGAGKPPVSQQAKLLGCLIDSRLCFKPHMGMITERMERVAFKLRKLAGSRSGVSPFELYIICYQA